MYWVKFVLTAGLPPVLPISVQQLTAAVGVYSFSSSTEGSLYIRSWSRIATDTLLVPEVRMCTAYSDACLNATVAADRRDTVGLVHGRRSASLLLLFVSDRSARIRVRFGAGTVEAAYRLCRCGGPLAVYAR
ncbi:hypothetical protein HPB50_012631 [Hyalomma asiaticum]|uniref:Uncharacterized protein n=1 Tax=Hyalomma asiaticum TaxID=266040 RepID=A0ACB7S8F3_HYAAI|nr:hypothetical protein HPB50_012631 [Hyalomma asiaticum]